MLKRLHFTLLCIGITLNTLAQTPSYPLAVSDFEKTDINGNTHRLYEYLEAGKIVLIDHSGAWCSPCWAWHETHLLNDFYNQYGPSGTDEVMVFLSMNNSLDQINGIGSGTYGDWTEGTDYPIIVDDNDVIFEDFGCTFMPAFSVVCGDKKKHADVLNDSQTLLNSQTVQTLYQLVMQACETASQEELEAATLEVYPNPATDIVHVSLGQNTLTGNLEVLDVSGKVVFSKTVADQIDVEIPVQELEQGMYYVHFSETKSDGEATSVLTTKLFVR